MRKAPSDEYAIKLSLYENVVATIPGITRKGVSMPYTSHNGHMFSFLTPDGTMALRLPSEKRESFLATYKTELCVQHGAVMKEYAIVPDDLLIDTNELASHVADSYNYVNSLKPKPSAKTAKTKKS
jgi:hypothetical protein